MPPVLGRNELLPRVQPPPMESAAITHPAVIEKTITPAPGTVLFFINDFPSYFFNNPTMALPMASPTFM